MMLLTLGISVALKLLTRVGAVDGRMSEKVRIVEESLSAPRLASATARRHGISNQLLFSWRKAYRAGRLGDGGFVPAMIVPEQPEKGTGTDCRRIEIVIANGRRVIVDCDVRGGCPAADPAWA